MVMKRNWCREAVLCTLMASAHFFFSSCRERNEAHKENLPQIWSRGAMFFTEPTVESTFLGSSCWIVISRWQIEMLSQGNLGNHQKDRNTPRLHWEYYDWFLTYTHTRTRTHWHTHTHTHTRSPECNIYSSYVCSWHDSMLLTCTIVRKKDLRRAHHLKSDIFSSLFCDYSNVNYANNVFKKRSFHQNNNFMSSTTSKIWCFHSV